MDCKISCVVAAALLLGNVVVCLQGDRGKQKSHFASTLGPELQTYYKKVVAERRTIYFTGLGWGLVIALVTAYMGTQRKALALGCLCTAITLGVAYLYYTLSPKHYSMLPHLETESQRIAWQGVYRDYKNDYVIGMVLGALGGGFLGTGICR